LFHVAGVVTTDDWNVTDASAGSFPLAPPARLEHAVPTHASAQIANTIPPRPPAP